jgi:hypothetical protein
MELTTITASTSRKINHAIYGGEQFESSDHFVSLSANVEDGEDPTKAHRELMLMCKEMANTSVSDEILRIQGGLPWTKFMELIREYRLNKQVGDIEGFERMNRLQKAIVNEMKLLMREKTEKELRDRTNE